jgi:ABC-2 type transport system permease protein
MPDFRESSPAKIAAGFGGTVSLVLSALFILFVVITVGLTSHLNLLRNAGGRLPDNPILWLIGGSGGLAASLVIIMASGLLATFAPLCLGIRAFRQLEP